MLRRTSDQALATVRRGERIIRLYEVEEAQEDETEGNVYQAAALAFDKSGVRMAEVEFGSDFGWQIAEQTRYQQLRDAIVTLKLESRINVKMNWREGQAYLLRLRG
jgi:hypothetical protein